MRKEEVGCSRKNVVEPNGDGVESDIAVKQSGERSGKVQVSFQNKPNQQKKCGDRNRERKRDSDIGKYMISIYDTYTPLNTSLENVYFSTCNTMQFRMPPP